MKRQNRHIYVSKESVQKIIQSLYFVSKLCVAFLIEVTELTAANVMDQVKGMSAETFAMFGFDTRLKKIKGGACTTLEETLCDIQLETRVKELRKLSGRVVTYVIYASQIKHLGQVQPESVFKSSWKKLAITIHDKSTLTPAMPRYSDNKVPLEHFWKLNSFIRMSHCSPRGEAGWQIRIC